MLKTIFFQLVVGFLTMFLWTIVLPRIYFYMIFWIEQSKFENYLQQKVYFARKIRQMENQL